MAKKTIKKDREPKQVLDESGKSSEEELESTKKSGEPFVQTQYQKKAQILYMKEHPDFANNELEKDEQKSHWKVLNKLLHKHGNERPLVKWQRAWFDKKRRIKMKAKKLLPGQTLLLSNYDYLVWKIMLSGKVTGPRIAKLLKVPVDNIARKPRKHNSAEDGTGDDSGEETSHANTSATPEETAKKELSTVASESRSNNDLSPTVAVVAKPANISKQPFSTLNEQMAIASSNMQQPLSNAELSIPSNSNQVNTLTDPLGYQTATQPVQLLNVVDSNVQSVPLSMFIMVDPKTQELSLIKCNATNIIETPVCDHSSAMDLPCTSNSTKNSNAADAVTHSNFCSAEHTVNITATSKPSVPLEVNSVAGIDNVFDQPIANESNLKKSAEDIEEDSSSSFHEDSSIELSEFSDDDEDLLDDGDSDGDDPMSSKMESTLQKFENRSITKQKSKSAIQYSMTKKNILDQKNISHLLLEQQKQHNKKVLDLQIQHNTAIREIHHNKWKEFIEIHQQGMKECADALKNNDKENKQTQQVLDDPFFGMMNLNNNV